MEFHYIVSSSEKRLEAMLVVFAAVVLLYGCSHLKSLPLSKYITAHLLRVPCLREVVE